MADVIDMSALEREAAPQPYDPVRLILDALAAGAVAFIPKRLSAGAMLSALRLVLSGERFIPSMLLNADGSDIPVAAAAAAAAADDDRAQFLALTGSEK